MRSHLKSIQTDLFLELTKKEMKATKVEAEIKATKVEAEMKATKVEEKEFEETLKVIGVSGAEKIKAQCKDYIRFSIQDPKQLGWDLRFIYFLG